MRHISKLLFCSILVSILPGCMPNIAADQTQAGNANQVTATVAGRIVSMQATTVTANDDNKTGTLGGAALGGIAGSAIGGGTRMNMLGAVGGALIGGIAGNAIQGKLSTQQGMQYTIKMPDGNLRTVIQGPTPAYSIGQCVLLVEGNHAHITPVSDESVCVTIPKHYHHAVAVQKVYVND